MQYDEINKPFHYNQHSSGVECIQIVRHMNFNLGNVLKYVWRNGLKESTPNLKDLKKARYYLEDEIQRIEEEEKKSEDEEKKSEDTLVKRFK